MEKRLLNKNIVLGSQSPRRQTLIKKLGIEFVVLIPDFDENLESDVYSDDKIKSLSSLKALSILKKNRLSNSLVISADTVVVLDNKILGKPKDKAHAKEMLSALSGRTHFVVTAITVLDCDTGEYLSRIEKTYVTFQSLSQTQVDEYILTCEPLDKAGSYGIQELGDDYIKSVDGDLDNVIGLPVNLLKNMLLEIGYSFV